jgi:hypothetical protein
MGLERLKEALEANDWGGGEELAEELDLENLEDEDDSEGSLGFGIDRSEMEEEMAGMKQAIYGGEVEENEADAEQDHEVEKLQAMMLKMQAVRGTYAVTFLRIRLTTTDMGADMPEAERKKFAAKAVNEIMKTL